MCLVQKKQRDFNVINIWFSYNSNNPPYAKKSVGGLHIVEFSEKFI